ncbi:MAG: GTPase ObgE [Thermoanaerobaculales bacterium]|nr:GTPase ObgE [Thermoanaerobaculales bacterium]
MLVDSARIIVRAGAGGNGCASFRREKFVPRGGPNGGDGGRGGDVILRVNRNFNTLLHIHHRRTVRAENGSHGRSSNKTGAGGNHLVVEVPPGTVVRNAETGEFLGDLTRENEDLIVAGGGRGGRGNARFTTPTNRAPRKTEKGHKGDELELELELKLMADIGLVGLPNAGKSTLLSAISAARPKVADYPFTTLEPHLGVVSAPGDEYRTLVMADIPGLIEGAHEGAGLGVQFLRHIERCRALIHLVDLSAIDSELAARVATIREELAAFNEALVLRPWILIGTKLDAVTDREPALEALTEAGLQHRVATHVISAVTGEGVKPLVQRLFDLNATALEEEL